MFYMIFVYNSIQKLMHPRKKFFRIWVTGLIFLLCYLEALLFWLTGSELQLYVLDLLGSNVNLNPSR